MSIDRQDATRLALEHIGKLTFKQRISDLHVRLIAAKEIGDYADLGRIADNYIDDFFRARFDERHGFAGFTPITGDADQADQFKKRIILPIVARSAYAVTLQLQYFGEVAICHVLVSDGAEVGDTTTIVDPFTSSFILGPQIEARRGSKTVTRTFNNGFGTKVATYTAHVEATCARCRVRICDGYASGKDSTPGMSAHADYKKSVQNDCCVVDYAFAGTGGWPDVEIKWSAGKNKFELKVSGFGWSYFEEAGSISCCCCPDAETFTSDVPSVPSSISTTTGGSGTSAAVEITCASIYSNLPPCDAEDGYDLTWDELLDKVRKGEGLPKNHPLRSEGAIQDDRGDYPGVGYHYNFYDDQNGGKHVGGGFGVRCCRDTEAGPQTPWKYKWTA